MTKDRRLEHRVHARIRETGEAYWTATAASLAGHGYIHAEAALTPEAVAELRNACPDNWHPLPEEEGSVRQHGFGAYLPMDECPDTVVQTATELVSHLSTAAETSGLPPVPFFNEVDWTRYPEGKGHITAHRDPPGVGGVIAVFTLEGCATFRLTDRAHPAEWVVSEGDLVVLRGRGWPTPESLCPVHAADPPASGSRMIMTLRFNVRGAGAPYFS